MKKWNGKPLLHVPHRVDYHVWSMKTITLVAIAVIVVTAVSVFLLGKASLFHETELTLAIIATSLFVFLSIGLFRGVRVKAWDLPGADVKTPDFADIADGLNINGGADGFDVASGLDGDGCLSAIVGFFLAVVVGIFLLFFLWMIVTLGILAWVFLLASLSWVFYLALRQVFAKSETCRGNWAKSVGYALLYTGLYTGWLFALVWVAEGLIGAKSRVG